jgi:hypothetical protein
VEVASDVTEVLTPEQRKIAAKALREKAEGTRDESESGKTSAPPEATGTAADPLWAGGFGTSYGAASSYGTASSYGFSTGYSTGYGGAYLF